ncbi:hypothetical protein Tco_0772511 [Tanacetum coccineum]|uniref:Uncharacterized protein n=1 Tax=Tanacetum coccineum TaxID=301880 RepID=A0ABQ4ZLJ5_9ASTR
MKLNTLCLQARCRRDIELILAQSCSGSLLSARSQYKCVCGDEVILLITSDSETDIFGTQRLKAIVSLSLCRCTQIITSFRGSESQFSQLMMLRWRWRVLTQEHGVVLVCGGDGKNLRYVVLEELWLPELGRSSTNGIRRSSEMGHFAQSSVKKAHAEMLESAEFGCCSHLPRHKPQESTSSISFIIDR